MSSTKRIDGCRQQSRPLGSRYLRLIGRWESQTEFAAMAFLVSWGERLIRVGLQWTPRQKNEAEAEATVELHGETETLGPVRRLRSAPGSELLAYALKVTVSAAQQ